MSKGRLLVVEDDVELSRVLRAYLTAQGYEVWIAHRGRTALTICQTEPLDLLLLDIKLPDMDGYEVLRHLRSEAGAEGLPCLILTQKDERSADYEAFAGRWDRYITKPFEFANLVGTVDDIIASVRSVLPQPPVTAPTAIERQDSAYQLTEQLSLWQTNPDLAQALMLVDRLTATKIHDMSKLGALLDLIPTDSIPDKTLPPIAAALHRCHLAYEQLNLLRYKLRRYQPFAPAVFDDFYLPSPRLRWQQLLDAIGRWLGQETPSLAIHRLGDEIHLTINGAVDVDLETLLDDLRQESPRAVYGYLVHKIVTRAGGQLEMLDNQLVIIFPAANSTQRRPPSPTQAAHLEAQLEALAHPPAQPPPPRLTAATARLIAPLATELLAAIEATLDRLDNDPAIDAQRPPWLPVRRNLRFFRLLAFDLCPEQPFHPQQLNLKKALVEVKGLVAHRLIDHQLIIKSDVVEPILTTDETWLQCVLVTVTLAALETIPENGRLFFGVKMADDGCEIEIRAEGSDFSVNIKGIERYLNRLGASLSVDINGEVLVNVPRQSI